MSSINLSISADTPQEFLAILGALVPVATTMELDQQAAVVLDTPTERDESATLDDTKAPPAPETPAKRGRPKKTPSPPASTPSASPDAQAETASDDSDRDDPIEGIEIEDDDVARNAIIESVTTHFMTGDSARRELIAKFKTDNGIGMIREIAPAQFPAAKALLSQLDALAGI